MPWNKPGQNNRPSSPWGNGNNKNNQSPPDLDKLISEFFKKVRSFLLNKSSDQPPTFSKSSFGSMAALLGILILAGWFFSGFFIVNPAEQAVILRFGKYTETVQPGLHWIAHFIETKQIVNVQKVYSFSIDGDYLTKSSDQDDLAKDAATVVNVKNAASDQSKNLVHVELNVMYRISDPRAYLFNLMNPDGTIRQVAASALSQVVGTMKLDDVLTTGRELLASNVLSNIRQILAGYRIGLEVTTVTLKRAQAPDEVRDAFNDVNRAEQDRKTSINKAETYASKVIPIAQGVAARTLADANAYRQQIVLQAKADVARYQVLQHAFSLAPEITSDRMYFETMQTILTHTTKILIDSNAGNNVMYLPIDRLPAFSHLNLKQASLSNDLGEKK